MGANSAKASLPRHPDPRQPPLLPPYRLSQSLPPTRHPHLQQRLRRGGPRPAPYRLTQEATQLPSQRQLLFLRTLACCRAPCLQPIGLEAHLAAQCGGPPSCPCWPCGTGGSGRTGAGVAALALVPVSFCSYKPGCPLGRRTELAAVGGGGRLTCVARTWSTEVLVVLVVTLLAVWAFLFVVRVPGVQCLGA